MDVPQRYPEKDRLGTQFSLAKKDMLGNIKRIEDRFKINPTLYVTLNSILDEDSKASQKFTSAVIGILWLKRGLQFLQAFILGLAKDFHNNVQEENMRNIVLAAYETTLKPYHGKVSRFLFANLTRFVPYRSKFIKALMLSDDATVEMIFSDIDLYITDFTENLDMIDSLLNQHGLNSEERS
ncbi:Pleckstrin y domain-containing A member 8 [Bulinus truncatus]|nr:Pleckstrin y domain-containing A member 8 [Bulinus truncatus]